MLVCARLVGEVIHGIQGLVEPLLAFREAQEFHFSLSAKRRNSTRSTRISGGVGCVAKSVITSSMKSPRGMYPSRVDWPGVSSVCTAGGTSSMTSTLPLRASRRLTV